MPGDDHVLKVGGACRGIHGFRFDHRTDANQTDDFAELVDRTAQRELAVTEIGAKGDDYGLHDVGAGFSRPVVPESCSTGRLKPAPTSMMFDVDLVRKLVHVVVCPRKELVQLMAGGVDGLYDALRELAVLEMNGEFRGNLVPEPSRHPLVDSAVAEDDEAVFVR